jgi:hypothetical protein
MPEDLASVLEQLKTSWPSPIVARQQVSAFSGGLVSPGTLANHDSQGTGPEGAFRIGKNVGYTTTSLCQWLAKRLTRKVDMSKALAGRQAKRDACPK